MKKTLHFNFYFFLLLAILFYSCSSMNTLTLSVKEPAAADMPNDVTKVGIVDRTLPSDKTQALDDADKILSIEGKDFDKDGAKAVIQGINDELLVQNLFKEVRIIDSAGLKSQGMGVFPERLAWDKVEEICAKNNVDVLFELSFYDTETSINYQTKNEESIGVLGVNVPVIKHKATVYTKIKTGWRIYDPLNKLIVDEIALNEQAISEGEGVNPMKAIEAVMGRKDAVMQVSNFMGHSYALRLVPYYVRVSRLYYVRGTNNFKIGKRRAQTGDWDGAAELWKKETENPKSKVAGRACYNMAIISEINSDLDAAITWASKSYVDYKNKKALRYLNILKYRVQQQNILQNQ
jgi:hypothetical protein